MYPTYQALNTLQMAFVACNVQRSLVITWFPTPNIMDHGVVGTCGKVNLARIWYKSGKGVAEKNRGIHLCFGCHVT